MHKQSVNSYYFFGTIMRFLQDATTGWAINGEGNILANITWFYSALSLMQLNVTYRASFRLDSFKSKLENSKTEFLTEEFANELANIMREIRLTLDAEIIGVEAFIPSPKRTELSKLYDDIARDLCTKALL